MKSSLSSFLASLATLVAILLCCVLSECSTAVGRVDRDLTKFETLYVDSLPYEYKNTVKLIGYKAIHIPEDQLGEFNSQYSAEVSPWKHKTNAYYDRATSSLRVYFPVQAALVEHDGRLIEANNLGEFNLRELNGDCAIIGRRQTDYVTGVDGNVIKDGIIYLRQRNNPHHKHGKVYVYDFGAKVLHDHSAYYKHAKRNGTGVSCISNHGGVNCSTKFGISKGRCPFSSTACMDYNGWATNCTNTGGLMGLVQFPGSDCDYALGSGYCWNEIM